MFNLNAWYCEVPGSNIDQQLEILSPDLGVFFFTVIHFVTITLVTPRIAWAYYDVIGFGVCP
jgi:hypothetical protein